MSELTEAGFAYVRKAECKALINCKPSAAKAFIYIRSVLAQREDRPFQAGSRDFKECGLGRDAAASALRDLETAGLIRCVDRGGFTRGKKTTWQIVHTKASAKNTAGKPANTLGDTAGKPANPGRKTRQLEQNTAGLPDTLKETSSTSSKKSKEEEVSLSARNQVEHQARVAIHRDSIRRIERAAKAVAMPTMAFMNKAGGPKPADLLARSFERGNLTPFQLRKRLADSEAGSAGKGEEGPMVFSVAVGGACG